MKFYIGVTDNNWYQFLSEQRPDEVNFWRPRDKSDFRAIQEGAPFLFKLHSPLNYIVGGGFFVRHLFLPLSLVWDAFGIKNGAATYNEFFHSIMRLNQSGEVNPTIGCTILTEPFFFDRDDWSRRCGITGEKTLPVLETAHIKPYSMVGPNLTSNGLLLRSDMHILFDKGYITITDRNKVEVSRRIREEYENGRAYYFYHGKELHHLPSNMADRPEQAFLEWHQQEIYKG